MSMNPVIKADNVAFPTLQVPDLELQEKFLIDFGMKRVALTQDTLYMRGEGPQQYIHVSKLGEKKFLASAFYACSMEDLEKLSKTEDFSDIEALTSPGGGYKTSAVDPDGLGVEVVFGIADREPEGDLNAIEVNVGGVDTENFRRINQTKRFTKGRYPRIKRYGHYGLNSNDIEGALKWYHAHLGIIASDILKPGGEEAPTFGIFARLDRGAKPADHHCIFWLPAAMQSNGIAGLNHVSYEMVDIDDVFMGHEVLEKRGYELEWGIGRHYSGSQIFDYWRSPFQQTHEHQTDGDVFDNTVPPQIIDVTQEGDPANPEMGPSQWGPAINFETFGDERGI
jgi:hypothetical protein